VLGLSPPNRFRAGCGHPGNPGQLVRITRQGHSPASFRRKSSKVNLLMTVSDHWLVGRVRVLGTLWREDSSPRLSLDHLLFPKAK
jgi:hypothetical protein